MMSLKALISAEEGRAVPSSSSQSSPSSGAELGSWLSDYNNKGRGLAGSAVQSASASVSSLFSSLTSSSSASSSTSSSSSSSSPSSASTSSSVNPDATSSSSISSSWFAWSTPSAESQALTPNGSSLSSSTTPSSTSSSWLSSIPGYSALGGEEANVCFGLSWHQRLGLFFLSFFAGVLMLGLSLTFLSLILLGQSSKFTMAYALANIFFLLSSSFLTGPYQQLVTMFHPSRLIISTLYLLSLGLTLFSAWQVRVFYVVLPLLVVQVVCLLMYITSYLPFGLPMMKRMAGLFFLSVKKIISS